MATQEDYEPRTVKDIAERLQELIWDHGGRDIGHVMSVDGTVYVELTNDQAFEITVNVKA